MYRSRDMNEDSKSRVYMAERLMGCKVAGREEYLLMDQSSLTGVVYDSRGNAERTMTYRPALASEMENRKEEFKKKKDHGNKKIMNAALTGLVMTRAYESYLGITFFMGDYDNEDDIDEDDLQVSMTMMIYREPLNRKDGGTPFVSVNLNADRQKEKWLSLDGKFFTDRSEYEKAEGYSFEDLKNGKYGNEYRDAFSPFSLSDPEEEASTFQVQIPNYFDLDSSWYDDDFTRDIVEAVLDKYPDAPSFFEGNIYMMSRFPSYFMQFTKSAKRQNLSDLEHTIGQLKDDVTPFFKSISQMILSDALLRRIKKDNMSGASGRDLQDYFEMKGFLPKPGDYIDSLNINAPPTGFFGNKEGRTDKISELVDPGITIVSDHIVSVISQNGVYSDYLAPVDYFPAGKPDWENTLEEFPGVRMDPTVYTDDMKRTVYIHDEVAADKQIEILSSEGRLSESQKSTVEELKLLLRASAKDWGNVKFAWLINEILKDQNGLKETVSKDAAKAKEEGKISDEEYKKALELLNNILSDDEKNTVHETFEKARQDAKKKHDDGGLSDEEYKNAVDILDKAEQEKLGLNDEDWAVFQGLVTASFILADANRAIVSANNAGKKDTIARIEELAKSLPEEVREPLLYLCAGFQIVIENQKGCPLAYETVFPDGSSVFGFGSGDTMTAGGSLDSNNDGVVIAAESTGKKYSGNTFLIGYETADTMDLFNEFVCGRPLDLSSMEYDDGKEITTILAVCTDKGVRFFRKERKAPQKRSLKNGELKKMFGQENADLICGIGYMYAIFSDVHRVYNSKATLYNTYTPLSFGDRAYEAYESIIKAEGLPAGIDEDDFAGFMTYKMLLTSSGYTRDIENRLTDAIDESLEEIGARENNADDRAEREKEGIYSGKKDLNDRYTGHLNSSKNICMIGRNKALICSVTNGTKILDLDHGTVADDIEGSYYRAFQEGSKRPTDSWDLQTPRMRILMWTCLWQRCTRRSTGMPISTGAR